MLMRLGRWLRLMGQDVVNPEGISDSELLRQAREEKRTIITRDRGLFQACHSAGVKCLFIRSCKISDQLLEMAREGVPLQLDPERCTLCNTLLQEFECEQSMKWECPGCKKLYWQGRHWRKMKRMLKMIRSLRDENIRLDS